MSDPRVVQLYLQLEAGEETASEYIQRLQCTEEQACIARYKFARAFLLLRKFKAAGEFLASILTSPHASADIKDKARYVDKEMDQILKHEAKQFAAGVLQ